MQRGCVHFDERPSVTASEKTSMLCSTSTLHGHAAPENKLVDLETWWTCFMTA